MFKNVPSAAGARAGARSFHLETETRSSTPRFHYLSCAIEFSCVSPAPPCLLGGFNRSIMSWGPMGGGGRRARRVPSGFILACFWAKSPARPSTPPSAQEPVLRAFNGRLLTPRLALLPACHRAALSSVGRSAGRRGEFGSGELRRRATP